MSQIISITEQHIDTQNMSIKSREFCLNILHDINGVGKHFTKQGESVALECPVDRIVELAMRLSENLHGHHGEVIVLHTTDTGRIRYFDIYVNETGWEIMRDTVSEMCAENPFNFGFVYEENENRETA